jgi:hypothetical protein
MAFSCPPVIPFAVAAGWVSLHFLLYVALFRAYPGLSRETMILLYHVLSMSVLAVIVLSGWPSIATLVGTMALHGVYSLTFLELWSLSEGGYSLAILNRLRGQPGDATANVLEDLRRLGSNKKATRLATLEVLGLVHRDTDLIMLTLRGRTIAAGLAALRWMANVREAG